MIFNRFFIAFGTLIVTLLFLSQNSYASIYINKIINNTDFALDIEYSVQTGLKALYNGQYTDRRGYMEWGQKDWYPNGNSNLWLRPRCTVELKNAYIPVKAGMSDHANVITLYFTGFNCGRVIKVDSFMIFLASFGIIDGYLETRRPVPNGNQQNFSTKRIFTEKLKDGSSYSLEIRQILDEAFIRSSNKTVCNQKAFELVFVEN